jgi:hypothetical protein
VELDPIGAGDVTVTATAPTFDTGQQDVTVDP